MATIPSNVWEAERTFYAEHFEVEDPGSIPTDQLEHCDYKVLRQADDFMKKMVKENEELKAEIEKLKQEVGQGKTFYQEVMRGQQAEMDKEHIRYLEKVQEVGDLKAVMNCDLTEHITGRVVDRFGTHSLVCPCDRCSPDCED